MATGGDPGSGLVGQRKDPPLRTALLHLSLAVATCAAPGSPINPAGAALLRQALGRMTEFRDRLPEEHSSLDALVAELEFSPEDLLRFVEQDVHTEPYPGLLRGAKGALWARAGNSLDQALLARELLLRAGVEARLGTARLTLEQARRYLEGSLRAPLAPPAIEGEGIDDLIRQAVKDTTLTQGAWERSVAEKKALGVSTRARVEGEARRVAGALVRALSTHGTRLEAAPLPDEWIQEARDYYWVQWRTSASEPWRDAHPAAGPDAALPGDLVPAKTWRSGYPEGVRYHLEVRLQRELRRGAALEVADMMTPWEGPLDSLYGRALRFQLLPEGAQGPAVLRDRAAVLRESQHFLPLLGGALAPGARAMTRSGALEKAGGEDVATALGGLGGGFSGALTAGKSKASSAETPVGGELTAVWLDLAWHGPGGFRRSARRMILDRLGATARKEDPSGALTELTPAELGARLTAEYRVVPDLGAIPGTAFFSEMLGYLTAYQETLADALLDPDGAALSDLGRHTEPVHLPLLTRMHAVPHPSGVASFRHRPGLLLVRAQLNGQGERLQREIDIVANPRRGFDVSGKSPVQRPDEALFAGVWETAMEHQEPARAAVVKRRTAFASLEDPAHWSLAGTALPEVLGPGARSHIRSDLAEGRKVLLRPAAGDEAAWWRVDPRTGVCLGRTGSGAGSSMSEYQITVEEVSQDLTIILNGYGVAACLDKEHVMCCLGHTALLGSAGFAGGAAIAAGLTGKAAWAFFALWDVGGGVGSTFIPDPCNEND